MKTYEAQILNDIKCKYKSSAIYKSKGGFRKMKSDLSFEWVLEFDW